MLGWLQSTEDILKQAAEQVANLTWGVALQKGKTLEAWGVFQMRFS